MAVNLLQLQNNKWAKVIDITGGFGFIRRLENLGIRVGIRILKISGISGPVIVKVGQAQVAIGRGMASKIIVEEQ